jgi:hypothetical protein
MFRKKNNNNKKRMIVSGFRRNNARSQVNFVQKFGYRYHCYQVGNFGILMNRSTKFGPLDDEIRHEFIRTEDWKAQKNETPILTIRSDLNILRID